MGWHNAGVRIATIGSPANRPGVWAVILILLSAGCVSISPIPTASPRATGVQPSATAPATSGPIQTAQPTNTPGAPPSPGSTATPGVPGTPGPSIDPALAQQIDAVLAQVPAVRELEPLADVPYEFISREQFREDLIELQFEEVPEERLRAEERALKRLNLLPDDSDLLQLLVDLYGGQVAAFYRPDTKRFYIIERDEPFGPGDKIIVAHEYAHALQDQHFDLEDTRVKDLSEGDAALGQLGAIEGDATLTMQLWMLEHLTFQEQIEALLESMGQLNDPTLASMPPVLRRQLEFPYAEGFSFIQELYNSGGFDAVNATLTDAVPASTEQILHPEKYLANELPVAWSLDDRTTVLGDGWTRTYEQTVGELIMQIWAAGGESPPETIPGLPVEWPHAETVAGWGYDRLHMYEHPDGRWAIVWRTQWDTLEDQAEYGQRAQALLGTLDGVAQIRPWPPSGDTAPMEELIVASEEATLGEVALAFEWPT